MGFFGIVLMKDFEGGDQEQRAPINTEMTEFLKNQTTSSTSYVFFP